MSPVAAGVSTVAEGARRRPFLTAEWRDLVMLTWVVDPSTLRPLLPHGTELDLYQGDALASVVAFSFTNTKVHGVRYPFHANFPEVNLRFYVRRKHADGSWRRGVTFVKEIVPRPLIASVARLIYGEPYVSHPMHHHAMPSAQLTEASGDATRSLVYEWKRDDEWERVIALLTSAPRPARGGSIEEFITGPNWGYTPRGPGAAQEYEVVHDRWRITPVSDCFLEADVNALYGRRFGEALAAAPISTFVAEGSPVAVYPGQPVSP